MHNREKPSQDYVDLLTEYKELHKDPKYFNGICLITHLNTVTHIMLKEGAKSLLDYGCGKALLYDDEKYKNMKLNKKGQTLPKPLQKLWQLDYHALYDPAYPKHSKLPKGKYDAVICTDVIEHIDEKDADWILEEIFSYSRKFVLLTIACYKALKTFKDGRNVHVNVKTPEYWKEKLLQLHAKHPHLNIHYSLDVIEDEEAEKPVSITEWKLIERK
tara:strand:+ start:80 stop:727 length:648 start_codon:yes stop_codon:yes gene_type:complete